MTKRCQDAEVFSCTDVTWTRKAELWEFIAVSTRGIRKSSGNGWNDKKTTTPKTAAIAKEIAKELSLPPVKIHCSVLAEDAIKAAVADFKKKRAERQGAVKAATTA